MLPSVSLGAFYKFVVSTFKHLISWIQLAVGSPCAASPITFHHWCHHLECTLRSHSDMIQNFFLKDEFDVCGMCKFTEED
jgi:hypothetical protein